MGLRHSTLSRPALSSVPNRRSSGVDTRGPRAVLDRPDHARRGRALRPTSPLLLLLVDPRALHLSVRDGLWLRLLDVGEALRRRSYAGDDEVVLEVRDALLPENAGRYRVGADVERTDDEPDLALDVADLASAYLGAFGLEHLAASGRLEERRPGAVARAAALFRTPLAPHSAEVF